MDEILNLIESVSEDFPSYSFIAFRWFTIVLFSKYTNNVNIVTMLFIGLSFRPSDACTVYRTCELQYPNVAKCLNIQISNSH